MLKYDLLLGKKGSDTFIIYRATNLANNKMHIGATINSLEYRQSQHLRDAKNDKRRKLYFHNAINHYGADSFIFDTIDHADNLEDLNDKERFWISYYDTTDRSKGYNLDTGGQSGGRKSEETKQKIGDTTFEKWRDPILRKKMLDGLRKGTKTFVEKAKDFFVHWECPLCGSILRLKPGEARKKKVCSRRCLGESTSNILHLHTLSQKNHAANLRLKQEIKEFIVEWCSQNQTLVSKCPSNKITTTLKPLLDLLFCEYGIEDIRSYFICFGVKNKKEFLECIKCCSSK